MMQKEHKENLNLLFYDFNFGGRQESVPPQDNEDNSFEDGSLLSNSHFSKLISNTGNNFYSRFGDRLPTRDNKSRGGRRNYIPS